MFDNVITKQVIIALVIVVASGIVGKALKSLSIGPVRRLFPAIDKQPPPEVAFLNYRDSGIQIRLTARAELSKKADIETSLLEQLYHALSEAGIRASLPEHLVHLSNAAQASQTKSIV